MFIKRNHSLTVAADLNKNIFPLLNGTNQATPVYDDDSKEHIGWRIEPKQTTRRST